HEASPRDRLAVEIDLDRLPSLDLEAGKAGAGDTGAPRAGPVVQKGARLRRNVRWGGGGGGGPTRKTVVHEGIRAEFVASAGLAAVADRENEKSAFPCEPGTTELSVVGSDGAEVREPGEQVGGPSQNLLQVRRRFDGHMSAEPSGRK